MNTNDKQEIGVTIANFNLLIGDLEGICGEQWDTLDSINEDIEYRKSVKAGYAHLAEAADAIKDEITLLEKAIEHGEEMLSTLEELL